VTETLTLRYSGGPFTFAFRDLPNRRLDSIDNITVREGERTFRQVQERESTEPYTFSVSSEDGAQRVRWVYPPTSDGTRTFTLRYDVVGAVRRSVTADEVWWALVFAEREELVEEAEGQIQLPEPVPQDQLDAMTPDVPGAITHAPGRVAVQARDIPPGRELTLRLRFPAGVVSGDQPAWQVADAAQAEYDATVRPAVMAAGFVFFLLSAFFAERYSWWLPVVAAVLALAGLAWLIVASTVRAVTQRGADALARWRAFQRYLRRLSADYAPQGQFDSLLPYSIALDVAAHVTKVYGATAEPLPAWYYPIVVGTQPSHGSGMSGVQPTLLLHDFSQNFVAAFSSAGGSGGTGGGAAAGGASGGGGGGAG
jgi:uncharacterized membrane protein